MHIADLFIGARSDHPGRKGMVMGTPSGRMQGEFTSNPRGCSGLRTRQNMRRRQMGRLKLNELASILAPGGTVDPTVLKLVRKRLAMHKYVSQNVRRRYKA